MFLGSVPHAVYDAVRATTALVGSRVATIEKTDPCAEVRWLRTVRLPMICDAEYTRVSAGKASRNEKETPPNAAVWQHGLPSPSGSPRRQSGWAASTQDRKEFVFTYRSTAFLVL
jgi:hypothetical protein